MQNQFVKWLFMLSYLVATLAAINVGLMPFGFNFFQSDFVVMNLFKFIPLVHYIILIAGLVLLFGFTMCFSGNHTYCHSCNNGKGSKCMSCNGKSLRK